MEISFWDLQVGSEVQTTGKKQNVYRVVSKNEKKIGLLNVNNNVSHFMDTVFFLKNLNDKALKLKIK